MALEPVVPSQRLLEIGGGASGVVTVSAQAARSGAMGALLRRGVGGSAGLSQPPAPKGLGRR